jgi:hypothetical protein
MGMEACGIKRFLRVGVVLGSFTLAACGSYGQAQLAPSASGMQYFTALSLQAVSSTIARTSSVSRQASAASRQIKDACAGNITASAAGDPHYHVQGTLSDGQSFNTPTWSDTSLGYAHWLTSPIDGGYNITLTQSELSDLFIVTSLVITTHSTRVQVSTSSASTQSPTISINDSGRWVATPPLSSNFRLTLSGGEHISWTLNPSPINAPGSVTTAPNLGALTETVSDGNTSFITTTTNYWYVDEINGFVGVYGIS